jgi:DNA-binding NarL/FixJ family response regulator
MLAIQHWTKGKTMIPRNEMTIQTGSLAHSDLKTATADSVNPVRVWLVDDNNEFRSLFAELLAHETGFDCSRDFPSSEAVLDALAWETPPDVILLDVQMRGECGLDAIRPIKSLTASTRVLMLTTCFDSIYRQRALREGATDYLLKSYSVEEIAHRIRQALQEPVLSGFVSVCAEGKLEEAAETTADDLAIGEEQRTEEFAGGRFKHDSCKRSSDRGWPAVWGRASNRLMRGAFYVRSLLAMLY